VRIKMEMEMSGSSRVKFITACSYLTNILKHKMKAQAHVSNAFVTLIIEYSSFQDQQRGKLIQKLLLNKKCMGYLVRAYYSISHTSQEEIEAKQNVKKVEEHLAAEEIEKLVEGTENVEETEVDDSTLKQDDNTNDPGTMLERRSNKESPEAEITIVVQPVNVNEEEVESAKDDYKFKRREKGKHVEESRNTPSPTPIRSPRTHSTLISSILRNFKN
ncbi:hypothetical protein Tco_1115610, partial [Tanacetum coccineum]